MDSSPLGSDDEQTFLLIRLPKETVEQIKDKKEGGNVKVGSVFVYDSQQAEFQDDQSHKLYTLMRNSPSTRNGIRSNTGSQRKDHADHVVANEESDLFKISIQRDEAVHLGKVKQSTLLAVPKATHTIVDANVNGRMELDVQFE